MDHVDEGFKKYFADREIRRKETKKTLCGAENGRLPFLCSVCQLPIRVPCRSTCIRSECSGGLVCYACANHQYFFKNNMRCFGHNCRENIQSGNPILVARYKFKRVTEYWQSNQSIFTVSGNIVRSRKLIMHCNLCGKYCQDYSEMENHLKNDCRSFFIQCKVCKQFGERNYIHGEHRNLHYSECKFCNTEVLKENMKVHLRNHLVHLEEAKKKVQIALEKENEKEFEDQECKKRRLQTLSRSPTPDPTDIGIIKKSEEVSPLSCLRETYEQ